MTKWRVLLLLLVLKVPVGYGQAVSQLKTFGTMGKEEKVLGKGVEAELFRYQGKGCLTHMWFGGAFKGVEQTLIRVYVDNEAAASIEMELFLGHGIGFNDSDAPWGVARMGKTGDQSGVYNTFRIPFGKNIRVTAQRAPEAEDNPAFWWIIRGTENLPVELGGVRLPDNARLKLYKVQEQVFQPFEEFALCDVKGGGALYLVTMAAQGLRTSPNPNDRWKDLSYQEACVRAYLDGASQPMYLSSGLEDYFLGTYYFHKGRYHNPVAGLTHFNAETNAFSAYRFHEDDPIFFQKGLRLTNRVGEKIGDRAFHDPPPTRYTTYAWVYSW